MAFRKPQAASLHNQIVLSHARVLQSLGYRDVRADDIGWTSCPVAISGRVPDVTATSPTLRKLIVEVETPDSLRLEDTRLQWAAFSAHALTTRSIFRVVVPTGYKPLAELQALTWRIHVHEVFESVLARAA